MLTITGLSHVYPGGTRALDGVDLRIADGLFGLLGPNGAGKSTLMRCIATLQPPTAGSIRLDDVDVIAEPLWLRRRLGYLPQDFGVYPRISALALLDHLAVLKGIGPRSARRDQVAMLLHKVNLWEVRDRAVEGFSGGMRRRFGIAQALLGRPRLIIVDEPTAGLDPEERYRCLDLLADVASETVVILSTHIVEDVAALCPRVAILAEGRVRREGTPAELVAALAGRIWRRAVDRRELPGFWESHRLLTTRLVAGETIVNIHAGQPPGDGFTAVEPTLEHAYFAALAGLRD